MEAINSCKTDRLTELIREASRPVIVTHLKPDGDALGSSIAMYHFLGLAGKEDRHIVLNDRYPAYLEFIVGEDARKDIVIHSEDASAATGIIQRSDLLICLDFNAFHRTENLCSALEESDAPKILIDHHLNPDSGKFDIVFSETEISSASELLYHILMATRLTGGDPSVLPLAASVALMTGMTTDTNNFGNSVFPTTLKMASELLKAGVDREGILNSLYNQHGENRLRLMGHMMKNLMKITGDGVAYIVLDKATQEKYQVEEGDTEGFVNLPLSIAAVRMSLLLKEDGDRVRVSIRSKRGTSANRCARLFFNGGGHENAAGGRLHIPGNVASIEEAAGYIETYTHKYFSEYHED